MIRSIIWKDLNESEKLFLFKRNLNLNNNNEMKLKIKNIFTNVKNNKDLALIKYNKEFDNILIDEFKVTQKEIEESYSLVSKEDKKAIYFAIQNIEKYHKKIMPRKIKVETKKGMICERLVKPINSIGLYVPGGDTPLVSSLMMLAVPAYIANCPKRILCTPPRPDGSIHPILLATARICKINDIFKVGGAQAIAAMAFGTESIPKVDKIFGPGNAWVTKAKQMLQQENLENVAFDLPAGPSEVLILGDEFSNPKFIASDLLAQAEHGNDSQVLLIATSQKLLNSVKIEIENQIPFLSRAFIIKKSLERSALILLENINQCIEFINQYAPEHLILQNQNPQNLLSKILNAGAIFIGNYTPESIGDYISGSNHVLPTNGFAKNYSGLSVNDFIKYISVQKLTEKGLRKYGKNVQILSNIEGLTAHKNSITIRLKELDNDI